MRVSWCHLAPFLHLLNLLCSRAKRFSPPLEAGNDEQEDRETYIPWHPSLDAVVNCIPGERHPRFPACSCGQYASKVTAQELLFMDESEMNLMHFKVKGKKKEYYVCKWCTMCPDGVIMTDRCRQSHDTQCDQDFKCHDPDYVFDHRIKACGPRDDGSSDKLNTESRSVSHNISVTEVTTVHTEKHTPTEEDSESASGQPSRLPAIIYVPVALGILVGLELLVFFAYLGWKKVRRVRSLRMKAPSTTSLESTVATACSCIPKETRV